MEWVLRIFNFSAQCQLKLVDDNKIMFVVDIFSTTPVDDWLRGHPSPFPTLRDDCGHLALRPAPCYILPLQPLSKTNTIINNIRHNYIQPAAGFSIGTVFWLATSNNENLDRITQATYGHQLMQLPCCLHHSMQLLSNKLQLRQQSDYSFKLLTLHSSPK